MNKLSTHVEARIRALFSPTQYEAVSNLLRQYGRADHENEIERVRRHILTLSKGDVRKLEELVKLAKTDYRDVIAAAESS